MATAYNFKNIREWENSEPGIAENVLIAPKSFFAAGGLKYPTAPFGVTQGDEITIKDPHVFVAGKGFVYFVLAPEKNELNTTTDGDPGFNKMKTEVKLVFPGSSPAQHEQLRQLLNTPLVALVPDSNCGSGIYYQLGTECISAYLTSDFKTGTTASGIKGFEATLKYAGGPLFYDVTGGPEVIAD